MNATLRVALTWFDFLSLQRVLNIIGGGLLTLSLIYGIANELSAQLPLGMLGAILILITPVAGAGAALRTFSARNAVRLLPHGRVRVLYGTTLAITLMAAIATLPVLFAHLGDPAATPIVHATPSKAFAMAWTCAALICIVSFIASASAQAMLLTFLVPILVGKLFFALWHPPAGLGDRAPSNGVLVLLFFTFAALAWLAFCAWYLRARSIRPTVHLMPGSQWASRMRTASTDKALAVEPPITRTAAIRYYLLGTQLLPHTWLWSTGMTLATMLLLWIFVTSGDTSVLLIPMMVAGYFAFTISVTSGYVAVQRARRLWLRAGISREELFRIAERLGVTKTLSFIGVVATGLAIWSLTQRPDLATHILLALPLQLALAGCMFYACLGITGNWTVPTALLHIAVVAWLLVAILLPRPFHDLLQTSLILIVVTAALAWLLRMRARRRWGTVHWRPVPAFDRRVT